MTTYRDIVNKSLRELGVLHSGEVASDDEGAAGLTALNQMLNSWIYDGIDMEHTTATGLTDTISYPDDHHSAFAYNLALRLAPQFGISPSPVLLAMASQGFRAMQGRYLKIKPLSVDIGLRWNPNRDTVI
jgi:hypothetical protein